MIKVLTRNLDGTSPRYKRAAIVNAQVSGQDGCEGGRSDAMKERASASGGCWKVQASVSTRLGGPYVRSLRRP